MRNPTIREYRIYHCAKRKNPNCPQRGINETGLERQIQRELRRFEIPVGLKDWALEVLKRQNGKESAQRRIILLDQRKEYDSVIAKIDTLIDMRANKELSEEEYRQKKATTLEEKERLFARLETMDRDIVNWLDVAERGFDFAESARGRFADDTSDDLHVRKEIFACLGSNYVLKDKKVAIDADKLLLAIAHTRDQYEADFGTFEPAKNRPVSTQNQPPYPLSEKMLGLLEKVRTYFREHQDDD